MNAPFRLKLEPQAYLDWEARQERRHELIDGYVQAMAGGTTRHFTIAGNIYAALRPRLRGGPCRPFPEGLKVRTQAQRFRYPDALIDCGAPEPTDVFADQPTVIFEVESPTTTAIEEMDRVAEYQGVDSVRHIVLVAQTKPLARVWTRLEDGDGDGGWRHATTQGLDGALQLPRLGLILPMAEIYEDVVFDGPDGAIDGS